MCFGCGLIFEDFGEIINHCESHYRDEKYNVSVEPPEFVLCAGTGSELIQGLNSFLPETISIEPTTARNESSNLIANSQETNRQRKRNPIPNPNPNPINSSSETNSIEPRTVRSESSVNPQREVRRRHRAKKMPNIPQNCPVCDVWCDDFRAHTRDVHNLPSRIMQCYKCKKFFKSIASLKRHISAWNHISNHCYHCEMEPPIKHPSEPRRHKCLFCKEWFPNHVEFKVHFKEAHDKDADFFFHKRANCNIFTCYICERDHPMRYYLVAHMKTHHDKFLRHTCPTCGKRRRTYGQLTQHMKTHEGKTYSCDQCDKQFAHYVRLRLHRLCHVTELNYKCEECSKTFKQRKYLTLHKAVHTNERKYACKFCDKTFNFTSARRAHEKSQHGAL